MLDIVDRGRECAFLAVNNSLRDLIGRQSGVTPNHADHRNVDSRKNIGRCLGQDEKASTEAAAKPLPQTYRAGEELSRIIPHTRASDVPR